MEADKLLRRLIGHFYRANYKSGPTWVWGYIDGISIDDIDPALNKELVKYFGYQDGGGVPPAAAAG